MIKVCLIFIWTGLSRILLLYLIYSPIGLKCNAINPENAAVVLGEKVTLSCDSPTGTGSNYFWYYVNPDGTNGLTIGPCFGAAPPGYSFDISTFPNACNLVMDSVTQAQATYYRCDRGGGDTASCSVTVVDSSGLSLSSDPPEYSSNIVQEEVQVACSVLYYGGVAATIVWDPQENLRLLNNNSIPIQDGINSTATFTSDQAGNYTVTCAANFTSTIAAIDMDQTVPSVRSNNSIILSFYGATTDPTIVPTQGPDNGTEPATTTPAPPPDTSTPSGEETTSNPQGCDCYTCQYNCISACQDWEIVVFVFSALIGVIIITLISLFFNKSSKKKTIIEYVLTVLCFAFVITIIAVGCSYYNCIDQLIVMIVFSVLGGIIVILEVIHITKRCCKAASRVNSRRSSRNSSQHNNANLYEGGVRTADVNYRENVQDLEM